MRIKDRLYYYGIKLKRVVDGDTIVVDLDRGHKRWEHDVKIRLSSINAPEMSTGVPGEESKQFLIDLLGTERPLYVRTKKSDGLERFVGHLYVEDEELDIDIDVNKTMVENHQAVPYMVDVNL